MEKWHFKAKNNPKEISKKIESALELIKGLVFKMNYDKNNSITFRVRKRILYPWYLFFLNSIVVNGKLLKTKRENETLVEVSFNQHFLWKLVIFTDIFVGFGILIILILQEDFNVFMSIFGTLFFAVGVLLWISIQKKRERNIQEYKTLFSEILKI
ncbi:DUF423 domain-containing protein [Aestuariivivens marinum]|uniref:DUF423 domain-containing protein n=1 Tax=Aestuariivivens marinum TaxID=2913555 RepID=UPI001F583C91|nr:DUF423 domain-containing protein [Aestuariivivens marinum]